MGWVKLDEGFFLHPKAVAAGRDARDLFLAALCWSNQQRTDGVIPASTLPLIAAFAGVADFEHAATRLVDVQLWHNHVEGWEIHDFLSFQQSRADREEWLLKERERKRRAVQKRWAEMTPELVNPSARNPDGIRDLSDTSMSMSMSMSKSPRSVPNDSSVVSQGGAGGDDDDGRLEAICRTIGERRHARALAAGKVRTNPARHLAKCVANARTEFAVDADRLLASGVAPDAIVAELDPDPLPADGAAARLDWTDYRNGRGN